MVDFKPHAQVAGEVLEQVETEAARGPCHTPGPEEPRLHEPLRMSRGYPRGHPGTDKGTQPDARQHRKRGRGADPEAHGASKTRGHEPPPRAASRGEPLPESPTP